MKNILVTGSSGFIGFHLARKILDEGLFVIGFDNENDYYDTSLKEDRRHILESYKNFKFYHGDLANLDDIKKIFIENRVDKVIHLAAQVGVRYSTKNPFSYIQSNIVGFHNILFLSKEYNVKKFIYASSSSIYGNNQEIPFSTDNKADFPVSLYAATKKSNEIIAYSYSHNFGLSTIGLRFFTVYGPWGRPDMAIFKYTWKIKNKEVIDVYNYGKMKRDFTYVDDIINGILKAMDYDVQYDIFNLGSSNPVELEYLISLIEKKLGQKSEKRYLPLQVGDMIETNADIQHTIELLGWKPKVAIEEGIDYFIERYNLYYG